MPFVRIFSALSIVLALASGGARAEDKLTVYAAASMSDALTEVGKAFELESGTKVVFSFAGTGTLARQIEAGAPADVFVSADEAWMAYVTERGGVKPDTVSIIARNSLVLVGPVDADPLSLTAEDLSARLGADRLAMADPDTVPAGRYGKAALKETGLWQTVSGQLAPMDNVRVALASVARGDTPLGIVYGSDALIEAKVKVLVEFPDNSHPEIRYPAGLVAGRGEKGSEFLNFLTGDKAQAIFLRYGFSGI
ncbi:molybdate ABC transporter substrate-binding protein [Roseibium sp.]|uniref:molybdate ABC transporter substrate-binding protein n=1 Tax=Roseibium sp. TaxID=1936156 RepID=UPI003A986449